MELPPLLEEIGEQCFYGTKFDDTQSLRVMQENPDSTKSLEHSFPTIKNRYERHWSTQRNLYKCADGMMVTVSAGTFEFQSEDESSNSGSFDLEELEEPEVRKYRAPMSGIIYRKRYMKYLFKDERCKLFVSGVKFNQDMTDVFRGTGKIRTFTFSEDARSVLSNAFNGMSGLKSVILHWITTLEYKGFACSGIRWIVIPATLREIGAYAFQGCGNLRRVIFDEEECSL